MITYLPIASIYQVYYIKYIFHMHSDLLKEKQAIIFRFKVVFFLNLNLNVFFNIKVALSKNMMEVV